MPIHYTTMQQKLQILFNKSGSFRNIFGIFYKKWHASGAASIKKAVIASQFANWRGNLRLSRGFPRVFTHPRNDRKIKVNIHAQRLSECPQFPLRCRQWGQNPDFPATAIPGHSAGTAVLPWLHHRSGPPRSARPGPSAGGAPPPDRRSECRHLSYSRPEP